MSRAEDKRQETRGKKQERPGVAAILFVLMLSILLITTSLVSTRLSVKEVQQSSELNVSDQAFIAAEAGVEEAFNRIEANPEKSLEELFPEQYNGISALVGDESVLVGEDGTRADSFIINTATSSTELGRLSWRQRKVYDFSSSPQGVQRKDETIEIDTSELKRTLSDGTICGTDGNDCDGGPIQESFGGINYCWQPTTGLPIMELTVYSWPASDFSNVQVDKIAIPTDNNLFTRDFGHGEVSKRPGESGYGYCLRYRKTLASQDSRRYLFRVRPIFTGVTTNHSSYSVDYRVTLMDSSPYPADSLGLSNNSILIDIIGQSGSIRRRLIVKKERSGRALGVFDFVLYSGDPTLPLCKAGVQQGAGTYDTDCLAVPIGN